MFRIYTSNVESINMMQVQIGKWLRENTAPEAVIATNDIGAIGYFSRRPIIDIIGLVTPEILPYFDYYREHKNAVLAFIQDSKPDYVVVFPRYFPELLEAHEVVYHVRVSDNTASEYVFPLKTDTFLGLALLRVTIKPAPSTMVVLKTKW